MQSLMLPAIDADLPLSLKDRQGDVPHVPHIPVQPEVLQQVMFAQTVAGRECLVEAAIPNDDVAATFNQKPERMKSARPVCERSMQQDENEPSTQRREERRCAVDGAPAVPSC